MTFDWKALLVFLTVLITISVVGRFLVFKVPAFAEARAGPALRSRAWPAPRGSSATSPPCSRRPYLQGARGFA